MPPQPPSAARAGTRGFGPIITRPISVLYRRSKFRITTSLRASWAFLLNLVGPSSSLPKDHKPFPSRPTALVSLVLFLVCLLVGALAAQYPQSWMLTLALAVMFSLDGVVLLCVIFDCWRRWRKPKEYDYRRNMTYTVLLVIISLVMLPILYLQFWYPALRRDVIQSSMDTVTQVYFPSVTVFQRSDWSSQGMINLFGGGHRPKCGLHWLPPSNGSVPACRDVADAGTELCDCSTNWDDVVTEVFVWQNTTYRAITLHATEDMLCVTPTTPMVVEVYFSYDTDQALNDSGRVLQPTLYLAVFDPTLTVQQALENGYTRMKPVNANGMVAASLGLTMRQASADATPAYDYDVAISSTPSASALGDGGVGWMSLFLDFPTFERRIDVVQKAMGWSDVVSMAGAWFSFFQIISWILSGAALQV